MPHELPNTWKGSVEQIKREPHEYGGEWVSIVFETGEKLMIFTRTPLVWVDSDRPSVN